MKKIEVIISQAIASDFEDLYSKECKRLGEKIKFTKIEGVAGQGNSCPKLGNAIWPQLNNMYILYCSENLTNHVKSLLEKINTMYPGEGAAAFVLEADILV